MLLPECLENYHDSKQNSRKSMWKHNIFEKKSYACCTMVTTSGRDVGVVFTVHAHK